MKSFFLIGVAVGLLACAFFLHPPAESKQAIPVRKEVSSKPVGSPTLKRSSSDGYSEASTQNRIVFSQQQKALFLRAHRLRIDGFSSTEWASSAWEELIRENLAIEAEIYLQPLFSNWNLGSAVSDRLIALLVERRLAIGDVTNIFNTSQKGEVEDLRAALSTLMDKNDQEIRILLGDSFKTFEAFREQQGVTTFAEKITRRVESQVPLTLDQQKQFSGILAEGYAKNEAWQLFDPYAPPLPYHDVINLFRQRAKIESLVDAQMLLQNLSTNKNGQILHDRMFSQLQADLALFVEKADVHRQAIPVK